MSSRRGGGGTSRSKSGVQSTDDAFSTETTYSATNLHSTTTISKNPGVPEAVNIQQQIKRLQPRDESWHVVVNQIAEVDNISVKRSRDRLFSITLISISKSGSNSKPDRSNVLAKGNVKGTSAGPNSEEVLEFILNYMLDNSGKPQNIATEDEALYNYLVKELKNRDLSKLGNLQIGNASSSGSSNGVDFNDQIYIHSLDQLKKTKSTDLHNDLNLTLKLVQKTQIHSYGATVSRRDQPALGIYASTTSTKTKVTIKKTAPFYTKKSFVLIVGFLLMTITVLALRDHLRFDRGNWPLHSESIQAFREGLYSRLGAQPEAVQFLSDAFENHNGFKPLTIHLLGKVRATAPEVIKQISKLLFGAEESDAVFYLQGTDEIELKGQVFKQLKRFPMSIIVLHNSGAFNYDFLTAMLDENYPHLEFQGGRVQSNQAVFIVVSDVLHDTVATLVDENDLDALDVEAKRFLKEVMGWPHRVIQRIRHTVPFV